MDSRSDDGGGRDKGEGKGKKSEEAESEPEDEEALLMKEMMGFSKFDTTKVQTLHSPCMLLGFHIFLSI